jgi:hypothetical protein
LHIDKCRVSYGKRTKVSVNCPTFAFIFFAIVLVIAFPRYLSQAEELQALIRHRVENDIMCIPMFNMLFATLMFTGGLV